MNSVEVHKNFVSFIDYWLSKVESRRQLAKSWNVSYTAIEKWQKGSSPSLDSLIRIASACNLTLAELGAILEGSQKADLYKQQSKVAESSRKYAVK